MPHFFAEVQVEGDMDAVSSQGFWLIAAYIFGKNEAHDKITMTAPMTIESKGDTAGQKIAMTAPLLFKQASLTIRLK